MLLALVLLIIVSIYAIFLRGGGDAKPKAGPGFTATGHTSAPVSSPTAHHDLDLAQPVQDPVVLGRDAEGVYGRTADCRRIVECQELSGRGQADGGDRGDEHRAGSVRPGLGRQPDRTARLQRQRSGLGSHDCAIQPGTAAAVLPVKQPIRREVQWSGLSSQPACAGTRTRVGAGTYTLHALLAGREGATSTFTLAG